MATKQELLDQARELGVEGVDETTKNEDIETAIAKRRAELDAAGNGDGDGDGSESEAARAAGDEASAEDAERREDARAEAASGPPLEHTQGGTTTRDDANDVGVPMLPGSADEPQGPEDALGLGEKRGDYSDRMGDTSIHVEMRPDGPVHQNPNIADQGEVEALKGGVETDPRHPSNEHLARHAAAAGYDDE